MWTNLIDITQWKKEEGFIPRTHNSFVYAMVVPHDNLYTRKAFFSRFFFLDINTEEFSRDYD